MKYLRKISIFIILLLLPLTFAAAEDHKHTVSGWTVSEVPTCTERGTRYGKCESCGKRVYRVVEARGHTFGEWTRCKENVRTRCCSECGATELEYTYAPEKNLPLTVITAADAQKITIAFEGTPGDILLTLPAGEAEELLITVPGGTVKKQTLQADETELTLPAAKENKSLLLTLPAREEPLTLTLHSPEGTEARSLTFTLPKADTALSFTAAGGTTLVLTVTGQGAGKTSVKRTAGYLSATLICADVLEIEYPEAVYSDAEAKALFTVTNAGSPVEWEFLSYFDFGSYAERGGVICLRLSKALDVGQPAIWLGTEEISPSTQEENGAAAAAGIRVTADGETVEAAFVPFWSEIRYLEDSGATVRVAAGAEGAALSESENTLTVHLLGANQSVYEDPDYRGLYEAGKTNDTFTRMRILGTEGAPVTVKDGAQETAITLTAGTDKTYTPKNAKLRFISGAEKAADPREALTV